MCDRHDEYVPRLLNPVHDTVRVVPGHGLPELIVVPTVPIRLGTDLGQDAIDLGNEAAGGRLVSLLVPPHGR